MSYEAPSQARSRDEPARSSQAPSSSLLELLGNSTARTLLTPLGHGPLTARELADRGNVALSTTYRYLEDLQASGLIQESVRLDSVGRHAAQYTRLAGDFVVPVTDDFTVNVRLPEPGLPADAMTTMPAATPRS